MGRGWVLVALLLFCLGAMCIAVEARSHESFSASTYAEVVEKPTSTVETTKEQTDTPVDPNNRYPDGYANTEHHWNPETEKYEETTSPKATSQKDAVPVIPKRYETGYTNGQGTRAAATYSSATTQIPDPLIFDAEKGRYPLGYHPTSTYAGASNKPTTTGGKSYYSKTSNEQTSVGGDFMHRYEKGYFPVSEYTQQQVQKPVQSSYTGNFQSMPYPNGAPFVASGAGCRTAYWAENVKVWPSFFTVKSTVADAFGSQATATFGQTTILQALLKYGSDPYNELLRSGCTALLNSYCRGAFPDSHMKVIEQFNAALASKEAATAQALAFETINVESISAGSAC